MDHIARPLNALRGAVIALALLAAGGQAMAARAPAVEAVRLALQQPGAEAAVALADRVVVARPQDADAWYYAGQAYGRMAIQASMLRKPGWASKTRDAFQKAVSLDPDHLDARQGLVQFYTMAPAVMGGGKDKAAAEITAYAARNAAGGHYLRAASLDGPAAEREWRAAVRLSPDDSRFRRGLVAYLDRGKRAPEALAEIDAGLARNPRDARLLYMLGRHAALHDERRDAGLAALDALLARPAALPDDVSQAGAHWRRGQLREQRGLTTEALADYRRAVALQPTFPDARKDLDRLARTTK